MPRLILVTFCLLQICTAYAYRQDHSPFLPGTEPEQCALTEIHSEYNRKTYTHSFHGKGVDIEIILEDYEFRLIDTSSKKQIGQTMPLNGAWVAFGGVYSLNISPDKKPDYVIIQGNAGMGIAGSYAWHITMVSHGDTYVISSIESFDIGKEDWIKIGKSCQLIQTGYAHVPKALDGRPHNFFVYNLLAFSKGKMVHANHLIPGLPKWILYTYDGSHSATKILSKSQKKQALKSPDFFGRIHNY